MATRTNIAERLSHIIGRLDKEVPSAPQNSPTLLAAWRAALKPAQNDDLILVSNIGLISSAMLKLERQVNASLALQPACKAAANNTILQLKNLFVLGHFNQAASNYKSYCSVNTHGMLGVLGMALASEFSEPRLEPADADEIKKALLDIKELLNDSSIPLDLRYDLTVQIDQMLGWLNDLDIISSSELYEKIGASTFTAKLISDAETVSEKTASHDIFNKMAVVANRMISIMRFSTKFVDGISQLDTSAHHFLSLPPP